MLNLHNVADNGVYAGHVAINVWMGANPPEGVPAAEPNEIARVYWDLHTNRDQPEHLVTA